MNVICAWCGKILKEGPEPTSHGICRKCAWTFSRYYRPEGDGDTQRFVDIACYAIILAAALLALGLVIWRCL